MVDTITVEGRAKRKVSPDTAEIKFTVIRVCADCACALDTVAAAVERLSRAVSEACPTLGKLKTGAFTINAEYASREENGIHTNFISGYRCSHHLAISFPFEKSMVDGVLTSAALSGAEPETDIRFAVSDVSGLKEGMLQQACEDAKGQAEIIAAAMGQTLTGSVSTEFFGMDGDGSSPVTLRPMLFARSAMADIAPSDAECECRVKAVFGVQRT